MRQFLGKVMHLILKYSSFCEIFYIITLLYLFSNNTIYYFNLYSVIIKVNLYLHSGSFKCPFKSYLKKDLLGDIFDKKP